MNRSLKAEDEFLAGLDARERSMLVDVLRRLAKRSPTVAESDQRSDGRSFVAESDPFQRGPVTPRPQPVSPSAHQLINVRLDEVDRSQARRSLPASTERGEGGTRSARPQVHQL
jgi:hypothetical protein